ncbi:MAG: dehydrogenase [Opitutaceae bacterium]|nr:dehydrogenase [Opitutaceae bacterium]
MNLIRLLLLVVAVDCAITLPAPAQIGDKQDKPGVVQTLIVPRELIPPSPALTPAEALKTFRVAPGFRLELVASDPLIGDPVAMTIGPDGRIWVVEMRSFMPDLDGNGEDAPTGRVVVLEDTDGDGRMDKRTVFLDHLVMPRAIMLVGEGALIGAPPKLWYCRDTNGDGVADEKIEVASDYGIQVDPKRPEIANPERAPNAPLWALDNWIYSAAYTKRFRFSGGQWSTATTTFRGQWGLSQDDDGHLFYNSNSDQLRSDILPSHYLGRNPIARITAGMNVNVATTQFVWPARVNPGINRGYQPEMLRDYKLKAFTAACAPWIYRGDLYGREFYGNAFVCEPAGNLVKRNVLTAAGGTLSATDAYHESEFLASTDERFRPVSLSTGPDGALYVVDLYRGVLEHRISLTSYLRKQSEERGLDTPIGLGRIYRIVPEGKTVVVKPQLHRETPAQWVAHLSHANSWWRTTAQRLLVERSDASIVPALQQLATAGANPLGRLHALWTLEGMSRLDETTAIAALRDRDPRVRAAAIRVSEVFLKSEIRPKLLPKLIAMTTTEAAPFVQQQLALTLGEAGDKAADFAVATLVKRAPETAFLREAALSGLFGRELELLERLLSDAGWTVADRNAEKFLGSLAGCVFAARRSERTERLLALIAAQPPAAPRTAALVDGILDTAPATVKKPVKFTSEPTALAKLRQAGDSRVAKIAALMTWPGQPGAKPGSIISPLTPAQQASFELGKTLYGAICAACHQPHGLGMEGLAPPLVDSEWVLGSEQRLTRIILHGVTGPLKVLGRTYTLDMPALGLFDDEQVAGLLTYIRREWDHAANPVASATIKTIRAANSTRMESWRQEELLKIP